MIVVPPAWPSPRRSPSRPGRHPPRLPPARPGRPAGPSPRASPLVRSAIPAPLGRHVEWPEDQVRGVPRQVASSASAPCRRPPARTSRRPPTPGRGRAPPTGGSPPATAVHHRCVVPAASERHRKPRRRNGPAVVPPGSSGSHRCEPPRIGNATGTAIIRPPAGRSMRGSPHPGGPAEFSPACRRGSRGNGPPDQRAGVPTGCSCSAPSSRPATACVNWAWCSAW